MFPELAYALDSGKEFERQFRLEDDCWRYLVRGTLSPSPSPVNGRGERAGLPPLVYERRVGVESAFPVFIMNAEKILLIGHIASGTTALLVGPIAMAASKKQGVHSRAGTIYHWLVLAVCLSAIPLSLLHWDQSWHLFFIALFSYSFAFRGYRAVLKRPEGWLKTHIGGMLGSYIALVTAFLVVNSARVPFHDALPPYSLWFLPAVLGTPLIILIQKRALSTPTLLS